MKFISVGAKKSNNGMFLNTIYTNSEYAIPIIIFTFMCVFFLYNIYLIKEYIVYIIPTINSINIYGLYLKA